MSNVTTTCRDISELNPLAQTACNLFMAQCKKENIDIFITETYRSQARQDYLYASGRTRSGSILTNAKVSNHTGRMAWDIACNGKSLYDNTMLAQAGAVARKLGITWGGDWTRFVDKPHFEITSKWVKPELEDEEMTQEQFNAMMDKYLTGVKNEPVSGWAKDSFDKAKKAGILDGTMPQSGLTREQLASVLDRLNLLD